MRKIFTFIAAMALALAAFAQTPEEIVARMEEEMSKREVDGGFVMTMDLKIPILGTMTSKAYSLGDKMRLEGKMMGVEILTWIDGDTEWEYNSKENQIKIRNHDQNKQTSEENNAELFQGITGDYDLSISKETDSAWYIKCKKSKTNTNKDDPKTMDLVVAKGTYYPMSLSAKLNGITVTMRDLAFQVTEKQVTFNPADFPGVRIVDERKAK